MGKCGRRRGVEGEEEAVIYEHDHHDEAVSYGLRVSESE